MAGTKQSDSDTPAAPTDDPVVPVAVPATASAAPSASAESAPEAAALPASVPSPAPAGDATPEAAPSAPAADAPSDGNGAVDLAAVAAILGDPRWNIAEDVVPSLAREGNVLVFTAADKQAVGYAASVVQGEMLPGWGFLGLGQSEDGLPQFYLSAPRPAATAPAAAGEGA